MSEGEIPASSTASRQAILEKLKNKRALKAAEGGDETGTTGGRDIASGGSSGGVTSSLNEDKRKRIQQMREEGRPGNVSIYHSLSILQ